MVEHSDCSRCQLACVKGCDEDPEESLAIPHFSSGERPVLVSLEFLQPPVGVGKSSSKAASQQEEQFACQAVWVCFVS